MKEKFTQLLDVLTIDYIKENPSTVYDLVEALIKENRHYKDVIQAQRQKELLASAMLSDLKDHHKAIKELVYKVHLLELANKEKEKMISDLYQIYCPNKEED